MNSLLLMKVMFALCVKTVCIDHYHPRYQVQSVATYCPLNDAYVFDLVLIPMQFPKPLNYVIINPLVLGTHIVTFLCSEAVSLYPEGNCKFLTGRLVLTQVT